MSGQQGDPTTGKNGENSIGSMILNVLALVGLVSVVIALATVGQPWISNQMRRPDAEPVWPKPYRLCRVEGAPAMTDAQLIAAAASLRDKQLAIYSERYRAAHIDGPELPEQSKVYHWDTPRTRSEVRPLPTGAIAPGYSEHLRAAEAGLTR